MLNAVLGTALATKCVSAAIKASSETWEPHFLVFLEIGYHMMWFNFERMHTDLMGKEPLVEKPRTRDAVKRIGVKTN